MIPNELVQKIIDRAEIVEVISEFVSLHKSGTNYKGLCPFHNEKTPSFMVSPGKQIFKCFGCGESGTAVSFIMKHENISFSEAIKWLGSKYSIEIKERELTTEEQVQQREHEAILSINSFAQKYFSNILFNTPEGHNIALKYLSNRGLTNEIIQKFQLGYSLDVKDHFYQNALKSGYSNEIIEKSGLIVIRENEGIFSNKSKYLDRFHSRIIFPIQSLSGQIIGFGGRTMSSDKNIAKYINSPETLVYNKSNSLYGIFFAKNEIVKKDKCYLVEGYMDVISMHLAGITNTLASSGTSLTEDQIRLIRRFTNNITLLFDADSAGQKATLRGINIALKEGMNVRILRLPNGEDPDTFCQKYPLPEILDYFNTEELDFLPFLISQIPNSFLTDPVKKSQAVNEILTIISNISDKLKRDEYIKYIANQFNLNVNNIYAEINKILEKESHNNQQKSVLDDKETKIQAIPQLDLSIDNTELFVIEKQILYYLLKFGDRKINDYQSVAEQIFSEIDIEGGFRNKFYKDVYDFIKENIKKGAVELMKLMLNGANDYFRQFAIDIEASSYTLSSIWENNGSFVLTPEDTYKTDVVKTIISYKIFIINEYLKELTNQLVSQQLSEEEKMHNLSLSQQLIQTRRELIKAAGNRNLY